MYPIESTCRPVVAIVIGLAIIINGLPDDRLFVVGRPTLPSLLTYTKYFSFARIKSEVIREGQPKYIQDEHINFKTLSQLVTKISPQDNYSILIDGKTRSVFTYSPYTCEKIDRKKLTDRYQFSGSLICDVYKNEQDGTQNSVNWVGVAALWTNAGHLAKTYKQVDTSRHMFTMVDSVLNSNISMVFNGDFAEELTLEWIDVIDLATGKITQTYNIIRVSYDRQNDEQSAFSLPIGYGCAKLLRDEPIQAQLAQDENEGRLKRLNLESAESYKLELEISSSDLINDLEMMAHTDVVDLVIAKAPLEELSANASDQIRRSQQVKLLHLKGFQDKASAEMKQVLDYSTGIKYTINMKSDECTRELIDHKTESLRVSFKNSDGSLLIDDCVRTVLENSDGFILMKKMLSQERGEEYLMYEREDSGLFAKEATIIKTYSKASSKDNLAQLKSARVILYNKERTKVDRTYLFLIVSRQLDLSYSERASLFDISDCFQAPTQRKWIQIDYPVTSGHITDVTESFYARHSSWQDLQLNFLRVPILEQTIDDYYLVLRALVLDTQPDPLVRFEIIPGLSFKEAPGESGKEELHVAANVRHCSDICKMYKCVMFAYCHNYECKVTTIGAKPPLMGPNGVAESSRLVVDRACTLYSEAAQIRPNDSSDAMTIPARPMMDILAQLSHDDYSRLSEIEGQSKLTFEWSDDGVSVVTMVPVAFRIEEDPLNWLVDNGSEAPHLTSDDQPLEEAYHESVGRRRFRLALDTEGSRRQVDSAMLMVENQSYDDCAALCTDSGPTCGSFSYCHLDRQCITSVHYDRQTILAQSLDDSDCVIVQRDYLAKFAPLQSGVAKPKMAPKRKLKQTVALDEHDCAHQCMIDTDFNCLSFDYCPSDGANGTSECYLQATRDLRVFHQQQQQQQQQQRGLSRRIPVLRPQGSGDTSQRGRMGLPCWHYQRSFLADFNRIDHMSLMQQASSNSQQQQQQQLQGGISFLPITGINVDECASQCLEHTRDCNMFQFCHFPDEAPHQLCSVANGGWSRVYKSQLIYTAHCYIYTRKRDVTKPTGGHLSNSSESSQTSIYDNDQVLVDPNNENGQQDGTTGASVGVMFTLTIGTFFVSLVVGASIVAGKQYRDQLEQRYRRLKAMWSARSR